MSRPHGGPQRRRFGALALVALGTGLLAAGGARAAFPPPETAAREAFPGAALERRTWALSEAEAARVAALAGSALESRLLAGFVASSASGCAGLALLEAHEVRSKRETLLVSISPAMEVVRVDVLAFAEPQEYLPPPRWLDQFAGQPLGPQLELKRQIRGISGATLTSRAVTAAARRALAAARVLRDRGAFPPPAPAPADPAATAAPAPASGP